MKVNVLESNQKVRVIKVAEMIDPIQRLSNKLDRLMNYVEVVCEKFYLKKNRSLIFLV